MNIDVIPVEKEIYRPWIMRVHYAKRMPSVTWAFGLFVDGVNVGVVTYGKPASPFLCMGICGKDNYLNVYELNRLVLENGITNGASILISRSLKMLPPRLIIVSYADTHYGHTGYIYQASNWIYTGITKERTDMKSLAGHSRHNHGDSSLRQDRSAKHRYVTFTGNKRDKKILRDSLLYEVMPYPKNETTISTLEILDSRQLCLNLELL